MARVSYPQVVRVYCTSQDPDYENPWQSQAAQSSTGSGVVIGANQILTGAHVVANATFVQVQKPSDPNKVVARITAISHDSDLALLEVEDPAFTRGIRPAEIGALSRLRDEVAVVGYPVGGDELSITEGVVSRIEVQRYEHSQRFLLAVTVDAAINDGNSGGPVFCRGKVVGIAFQSLTDAQNIGEMVPAPVIERFVQGCRDQKLPAVPGLGIGVQNLENPALRAHLGLKAKEGGVMVTRINFGTTAWGALEKGDVLLKIDDLAIAANGTVRYRQSFRCQFEVVVGDRYVGDPITARVLRAGRRQTIQMVMQPMAWLVPRREFEVSPSWLVFGGLVFSRLTTDYLREWGDKWWEKAPHNLMHLYFSGESSAARQEVVIIAQVLADAINAGYEDVSDEVVCDVNGVAPKNLKDFVALVDGAVGPVAIRITNGDTVLFDAESARAANPRLLRQYRVPADRSADLVPVAATTARRQAKSS